MEPETNPKGPSWLNPLLLTATYLALSPALIVTYKGWKEDRVLHPGGHGHISIIADITVNLGGLPYQEHCLTCHPQGKAVKVSGDDLIFGKDHPSISPHSIDNLGCTACHLGEGMARDLMISHGVPGGLGARKVLAGEDLQASCYRCHELKSLPGGENAWEGVRQFSQNACDTCHNVGDAEGGRYGPDLGEAGSFLGLKQIQAAIEEPRADPENSIMPKFALAPEQIEDLDSLINLIFREFIRTKRSDKKMDWTVPAKPAALLSLKKLKKAYSQNCSSCHGIAGTGRGPD